MRELIAAMNARIAKLEAVVEVIVPFAESEPFLKAAAMEDPGRVPCFVNTEGARALRDRLAALDAEEAR